MKTQLIVMDQGAHSYELSQVLNCSTSIDGDKHLNPLRLSGGGENSVNNGSSTWDSMSSQPSTGINGKVNSKNI